MSSLHAQRQQPQSSVVSTMRERLKPAAWLLLSVVMVWLDYPCGTAFVAQGRHSRYSNENRLGPPRSPKPGTIYSSNRILSILGAKRKEKDRQKIFSNVTIVGIDDTSRNKRPLPADFATRKAEWEAKYGSAKALCRTFGGCNNKLWGDLDGKTARQLYHTLLPRSLLGLQEAKILEAEELAPLAYQARMAAKEYARMRSTLPNRLLAKGFDSYRSWARGGNPLNTKGLSWQDLWDKYEAQIVQEECDSELKQGKKCLLDREALMQRIYMRILERSCSTNQAFDRMFLTKNKISALAPRTSASELGDLRAIANQLDNDVREILLKPRERKKIVKVEEKAEKAERKAERKAAAKHLGREKKEAKRMRKQLKREIDDAVQEFKLLKAGNKNGKLYKRKQNDEEIDAATKQAQYRVLRIAANARRKLRAL